ncbi:MAG: BrnA antitoxin family protein [Chloroflexaceae bacterium]|nr:BrnA antitoxin family protein [Chloroflexaceae bacterium]
MPVNILNLHQPPGEGERARRFVTAGIGISFSRGKRGPVVPAPAGKTRITIRIDDDILEWFRAQAEQRGGGNYQTMMNIALREYINQQSLEDLLRRVVREELSNRS